jgi:hypothetical protein
MRVFPHLPVCVKVHVVFNTALLQVC